MNDDPELLAAWMRESLQPHPSKTVLDALENVAVARGWSCITAAGAFVGGAFDEALHPRGHDGRFIEIGGLMKIISGDHQNERGRVEKIGLDRNGRSIINLRLGNGDLLQAKPDMIEQAADKAHLDATDMPAVGRIPRSPKREGPAPTFAPGELDWIANRGQQPDETNEAGHKKWTYRGNETYTSPWGDRSSRPVTIRTERSDPAELDDEEVFAALRLVQDARYGADPPEVTAYRDALQEEWRKRVARSYDPPSGSWAS